MDTAMKHLRSHNVNIVKDASTADSSEVAASFLGCEPAYKGRDKVLWDACVEVAFVRDPDGYLIEIVPINPNVAFARES
jgi:lactoylglutathione lyase